MDNRSRSAFAILFLLPLCAAAQPGLWSAIDENTISASQENRLIIPNRYRTLQLNFALLQNLLQSAPPEADFIAGESGLQLDWPMPDGRFVRLEVWESPVMAPELCARFPEIRSFGMRGVDQRGMTGRFDISPAGLHAILRNTGAGTVYIDPYARGNTQHYISYFKKDFVKRDGSVFNCLVDDNLSEIENQAVASRAGECGNILSYRLALACTGEYANFHGAFGANKAPALAAMNTSINRVNSVYEIDCSVRLVIIANNTDIIYTDPATDPYSNGSGSTMLGQNQATCDGVIGSANYDIGHVFSTGGGGIAQLNCVCSAGNKARGVTGLPSPIGDPFDIDYVCHEIGHQFGGAHTQYNDNCNRSNSSAMEPGSASTIMGYAGVCDPSIQPNSDDYFHARSLQQIGGFVTTGGGNSCAQHTPNGNVAPVLAALTNRTIPKSTPFVLTASASDGNGDALTYCWEQMNAWSSPTQAMPPQPTNSTGPVFRSLDPNSSPSRYFPNYDDAIDNITPTWEVLPSVGRTMSFRVTVRDNRANGGCTTEQNMTVTTSASAGPFLVTAPNGGESYPSNSSQTVIWNVAGTSGSPVNCANVNILLSTDGGASFSTLLANTPNDGTQTVSYNVPPTTAARIMIQAVGNVFFDASNSNFTISAALPVELLSFNASRQGNAVKLDWRTATEKNNRGFHVERSLGNTTAFESIGWVDGRGNSGLMHTYSFTDTEVLPGETYYYRLRQMDFSGDEHYSAIRTVSVDPETEMSLRVQPNPAAEKIRLLLPPTLEREPVQVTIISPEGVSINQAMGLPDNREIDIHLLPHGLYLLRVMTGGRSYTARFFKR